MRRVKLTIIEARPYLMRRLDEQRAGQPQRKAPEPEVIEACYACPALLDDPGECLGPACTFPKFPRQMPRKQ
jgi:hypothetical protein